MNRSLVLEAVSTLGLQVDEQQLRACEQLLQELVRWNHRINLTAVTGNDAMTVKHLIDSLQLVPLLQAREQALDVGSGAGFPALVLAIMRPDCRISSIDAVGKKISFQRHVARMLQLKNFIAMHGRVEALAKEQPGCFDFVCSRAFSSLALMCELTAPLVAPGGRLVSMRAVNGEQEVETMRQRITELGLLRETPVRYSLPLDMGQRSLVILRKAR